MAQASDRDPYPDALRACALLVVVLGHWVATLPRLAGGQLVDTDHLLGIWDAAPLPRDDASFDGIGAVLKMALQRGLLVQPLLDRLQAATSAPEEGRLMSRRDAAKLLFAGGQQVEAGTFLPQVAEAAAAKDFEGLNLLARHLVARNGAEGKAEFEYTVREAGVYRLEAWLKLDGEWRPWVFANPVYVR